MEDHFEQEQRRIERYSDMSRSVFVCSIVALAIVAALATYALLLPVHP